MSFVPAIVCLLLMLQCGVFTYAWSDGRIVAFLLVFGVLIIAFILIQVWRGEDATLPPSSFVQRSILVGSWFEICLGGASFLLVCYFPVWFQSIKGTSAICSRIRSLLPLILSQFLCCWPIQWIHASFGYYTPFNLVSTVLMAFESGLLTTLKVDSNTGMWVNYQLVSWFWHRSPAAGVGR